MKRLILGILTLTIISFGLVACTDEKSGAVRADEHTSSQVLSNLQSAHPVPLFQRSQLRQNLVELTTAQAETTQTTTFMFNMGIREPINQCPSIGFPIPATAQLTNPQFGVEGGQGMGYSLPQVEPTGVYTGDTTGTYVMCVDATGSPYAVYWEGFVQTVTGPAEWKGDHVELVGPPSFEFSK